jgi:Holliday junction DNA helicase RuvA
LIGALTGRLLHKAPAEILLDVGGVGYRVSVPLTTFGRLPAVGSTVSLSVHTHVREDLLALYGFQTRVERDLFERLIAVPGVGPRLALAVLSHLEPGELVETVQSRDAGRLARVPGIGKKTAERLLLELGAALGRAGAFDLSGSGVSAASGPRSDLVSALVNLGYKAAQVDPIVDAVLASSDRGESSLETLLREALRRLASPIRVHPSGGKGTERARSRGVAHDDEAARIRVSDSGEER